jgi:DNA-binding SARP family transcriptional activator
LGDFQLLHRGKVVMALHQARLQSLLAYLILHAHAPQSRRHLAFRLWPDSTEDQARTNLRRELHQLRHTLPEADQFLTVFDNLKSQQGRSKTAVEKVSIQ